MSRSINCTLRIASFMLLVGAASEQASAQNTPLLPRYNLANQHTYVMSPVGLTWQTARSYSRTLGGHLVAINSAAEQAFLQGQYGALWAARLLDRAQRTRRPRECSPGTAASPSRSRASARASRTTSATTRTTSRSSSSAGGAVLERRQLAQPERDPRRRRGSSSSPHGDRVNFDARLDVLRGQHVPDAARGNAAPEGISWNGAGTANGRYPVVTSHRRRRNAGHRARSTSAWRPKGT